MKATREFSHDEQVHGGIIRAATAKRNVKGMFIPDRTCPRCRRMVRKFELREKVPGIVAHCARCAEERV